MIGNIASTINETISFLIEIKHISISQWDVE
jgi:hypothetical protein